MNHRGTIFACSGIYFSLMYNLMYYINLMSNVIIITVCKLISNEKSLKIFPSYHDAEKTTFIKFTLLDTLINTQYFFFYLNVSLLLKNIIIKMVAFRTFLAE